jgi:hypothetical protein
MADTISIKMNVSPERNAVLPGESLVLRIVAVNSGASDVEIPDPAIENPFTYVLSSVENPVFAYEFSRVRYKVTKNPEDRRVLPPKISVLPGGSSAEYVVDLTSVASESIRPGNYKLRVFYKNQKLSMTAPAVQIRVIAPQAVSIAAVGGISSAGISYILSNREEDGVGVVQWEGEPANPLLGKSYRRATLAEGAASVASSFESASGRGRRWVSWIDDDGTFSMLRFWGQSLDRSVKPIALNLEDVRLLSPGRVNSEDKARFLIVGRNGRGEELLELTAQGRPYVKPRGRLGAMLEEKAQANIAPPEIRRFDFDGAAPHLLHVRYYADAGNDAFQLVGVEAKAGGRHIAVRDFPGPESFRTVYNREDPLLALSCPPLQASGVGYIDALFGSLEAEQELSYVRIPLDTAREPREWKFSEEGIYSLVEQDQAGSIENWTLCSGITEHPPVAAVLGTSLIAGFPTTGGNWKVVRSGLDAPDALELLSTGDHDRYGQSIYAIFISEKDGVLTIPIA